MTRVVVTDRSLPQARVVCEGSGTVQVVRTEGARSWHEERFPVLINCPHCGSDRLPVVEFSR